MTHDDRAIATEGQNPSFEAVGNAIELTPVMAAQRIDVLDILRGFALIGILLMNIEWFNRAVVALPMVDLTARDLDHGAGFLVKVFIEGKFYKLFSLLFGMGFAVMLLRAERAGRPFFAWFSRRATVLLLIGIAHSVLLWTGDILRDYAIGAFMLLGIVWLRSKPRFAFLRDPRWLLRIAIGMLIFPLLVVAAVGIGAMVLRDPVDLAERHRLSEAIRAELAAAWPARKAELLAEARKVAPGEVGEFPDSDADPKATSADPFQASMSDYAQQSARATEQPVAASSSRANSSPLRRIEKLPAKTWFQHLERLTLAEFWEGQAMTSKDYWVATRYRLHKTVEGLARAPFFALFVLLPIFMLGWWLIESGTILEPEKHSSLFRAMAWIGWPFGLVFASSAGVLLYHPAWVEDRGPGFVTQTLHWCGQLLLCAAFVGSIVLLNQTRSFQRLFGWLAPLGRMALTNYLTHSLVFSTLFYGYGAGWFGQVPRFQQIGLVAGMIAFQAVFSRLWLDHFHFGPMEWLWRSATYLKWQPMRRVAK